jgi:hydroxyacylglutathione hydrolase
LTAAGAPRLLAWGLPLGPLAANAYVVADEVRREAVVIDPGQEPEPLLSRLSAERWRVVALLCTHAHFDHIGGALALQAATGATLYAPAAELGWLEDPMRNLSAPLAQAGVAEVRLSGIRCEGIEGGFERALGGAAVLALATPGHTPGGLSFHVPLLGAEGSVFTGDSLFAGTIGRSDLPGGDGEQLLASIRAELLTLAGGTAVLPGHGRATTIEEERLLNPFLG